jgi:ribokinase
MDIILNFGSVNIDHVYSVPHFVRPGETLASARYAIFSGGKGFNQSTALARAGAKIAHAGMIGADGAWLRDSLASDGADVTHLAVRDEPTGHAVIQVDASGQNCIIICGGANRAITPQYAEEVLSHFGDGDTLLLQNEISAIPEIMRIAHARGLRIVFNPAPMGPEVSGYPLDLVDLFIVNEVEAAELAGTAADSAPEAILGALRDKFPRAGVVLTLGASGSVADIGGERVAVAAKRVKAVDTTAAGDTYIGYFLASRQRGLSLRAAMEKATEAAAICVTRAGAAPSIPRI